VLQVWKISGSNLVAKANYSDKFFMILLSVPALCQDGALKQDELQDSTQRLAYYHFL
jgi:hypothetical protein